MEHGARRTKAIEGRREHGGDMGRRAHGGDKAGGYTETTRQEGTRRR
jgi:hypothetical protein